MESTEGGEDMRDASISLHGDLAAAEAGQPLAATAAELRERLTALEAEALARGWSVHMRGEYTLLCRAMERQAAAARAD